jgi:hypothetical protein
MNTQQTPSRSVELSLEYRGTRERQKFPELKQCIKITAAKVIYSSPSTPDDEK